MQYSPLNTTFSTGDGQQGGTLVLPLIEVFTIVFIRKIITVLLAITAKGLADAPPWIDDDGLTHTDVHELHTYRQKVYCPSGH